MQKIILWIFTLSVALLATSAMADVSSDGGYTHYQAQGAYGHETPTPVKSTKMAVKVPIKSVVKATKPVKTRKISMAVDPEISSMIDAN